MRTAGDVPGDSGFRAFGVGGQRRKAGDVPGTLFTFNLPAVERRDEGRHVAASKLKVKNVPYASPRPGQRARRGPGGSRGEAPNRTRFGESYDPNR